MRKCVLYLALVTAIAVMMGLHVGCTGRNTAGTDSARADTVTDVTMDEDSAEALIAEAPMPKAADELFDDFIFNFAANKRLQYRRIQFPLPYTRYGKTTRLSRRQWKMEHFFMRQDYYTLIFDNRRQMELVKDTSVNHVVIERIYLDENRVKQFFFDRKQGQWLMTAVKLSPMHENNNASFLHFYKQFSTDSTFQVKSMADEVTFTSDNPDDDFETQTGTIMPEQWPSFKPQLIPQGVIYNIIYGQHYTESTQKIFVIRGIANGLETEMVFRREHGEWKLVKFNG